MPDTPRPETIDDLPEWRREPDTVARVDIAAGGFAVGLGAVLDDLVRVFGDLYGDAMTVNREHGYLDICRDADADELQQRLSDAQHLWDIRARQENADV